MFQSVVWGWAWRRLLEVGGWVGSVAGVVYAVYQGLDPAQQEVLSRLIGRGWEQVTLGDLKLLAPALALGTWGYVQSWRATREPQVVTRDG